MPLKVIVASVRFLEMVMVDFTQLVEIWELGLKPYCYLHMIPTICIVAILEFWDLSIYTIIGCLHIQPFILLLY